MAETGSLACGGKGIKTNSKIEVVRENEKGRSKIAFIPDQFLKDTSSLKNIPFTSTSAGQKKKVLTDQPVPSVTAPTSAEERTNFSYKW